MINGQCKELLSAHGDIAKFWMDSIKTHCYVQYTTEEQANATREAVYNLVWPQGGRHLKVGTCCVAYPMLTLDLAHSICVCVWQADFVNDTEMDRVLETSQVPARTRAVAPPARQPQPSRNSAKRTWSPEFA